MVNDICAGKGVERYLLPMNPHDKSSENEARNKQYIARAVFYGVAGYTLRGLVGMAFDRPPKVDVPPTMDYIHEDVDGSGVGLVQQAKEATEEVLKNGRAALVASFPETDGAVSRADIESRRVYATVSLLGAGDVINWRTQRVGSRHMLSRVVISDRKEDSGDEYGGKSRPALRELALQDGALVDRAWVKDDLGKYVLLSEAFPTDGAGQRWSEIPLVFLGSNNNAYDVDDAPMHDLCRVNVAHYRNSADYEDSVWYCGQAQPWMSGITEDHVEMLQKKNMYVGSRSLLGVPEGETFAFAAAPPNLLVREAMRDKLELMIGLGARFIQPNGTAKTAQESAAEQRVAHSVLAAVVQNVSAGYSTALRFAARYMAAPEDAALVINDDFVNPHANAQELQAIIAGFLQGAVPMSDYLDWMKRHRIVSPEKELEEFSDELAPVRMPDMDSD
jgi:hypothetical protein